MGHRRTPAPTLNAAVSPAALREAAENATFTLSEAACGELESGATLRCGQDVGCESVTEQLDQRVRNIITHRHFLAISSRRTYRPAFYPSSAATPIQFYPCVTCPPHHQHSL